MNRGIIVGSGRWQRGSFCALVGGAAPPSSAGFHRWATVVEERPVEHPQYRRYGRDRARRVRDQCTGHGPCILGGHCFEWSQRAREERLCERVHDPCFASAWTHAPP